MTLSYSEIFNENSIEKIREKVVRIEQFELGYKSIKDQIYYLEKEYNFKFIDTDTNSRDLKILVEAFQIRNILLHNKGIVNQLFIENTGWPSHLLDNYVPIDSDEISDMIIQVKYIGEKLITALAKKYLAIQSK